MTALHATPGPYRVTVNDHALELRTDDGILVATVAPSSHELATANLLAAAPTMFDHLEEACVHAVHKLAKDNVGSFRKMEYEILQLLHLARTGQ